MLSKPEVQRYAALVEAADPGNTLKALPVGERARVGLTSAGAGETRTLAIPTDENSELFVYGNDLAAGSITLTCANAVTAGGATSLTFLAAGSWAYFKTIQRIVAGVSALRWVLVDSDGVTSSGGGLGYANSYNQAAPASGAVQVVPAGVEERTVYGSVSLTATAGVVATIAWQVETAVGSGVFATVQETKVGTGDLVNKVMSFSFSVPAGLRWQLVKGGGGGATETVQNLNFLDAF